MHAVGATEARLTDCRNCGVALHGPFCAACGQQVRDLDVSIWSLLAELGGTLFNLDSRAARTLGLLVARPGALTAEYLDGR